MRVEYFTYVCVTSLQIYISMKKISYYLSFLLLFAAITFVSCDDEQLEGEFFVTPDGSDPIENNNTGSITAQINGSGFSASGQFANASFQSNVFSIAGAGSSGELVVVSISGANIPGTYDIGPGSLGSGVYTPGSGQNASISNFEGGSGSLTITELDLTNLLASGSFQFTAINSLTEESTVITNGVFTNLSVQTSVDPDVEVPSACEMATIAASSTGTDFENATPENEDALCETYRIALENQITACGDPGGSIQAIINGLPCVDTACSDAITTSEEALAIFDMVDVTDAEAYTEACGNYSFALQEQIVACGDPDGSLQAIINELGDCSPPEDDGPVRMTIDGDFKNFNVAEAPINGSTFEVTATDVDVNDTFQFNVVLQQTGENVLQSVVLTIEGVAYTPVLNGETQFTSTITQNDGMVITGTFTGPMMNADGEIITITGGIIDIEV